MTTTIFEKICCERKEGDMMATDMFGRRFVEIPSVQFTFFCREDYIRHKSGTRAVLCRENDEKTTGMILQAPHKEKKTAVYFTAENGKTFLLPLKHLTIEKAADLLVIAIAESVMIENCTLYGLWETSYFCEAR
jgi:hypothetical protein